MTAWANGKLAARKMRIDNFKDTSLATGIFLINLIDVVHPGVVLSKIVSPGVSMEDRMLNAKYHHFLIGPFLH
jgi:Calponin homology (CH) domain